MNAGSSFGEALSFGATKLDKWLRDLQTINVFLVAWDHLDDPGWVLAQLSC